jgi:hypothetical protein
VLIKSTASLPCVIFVGVAALIWGSDSLLCAISVRI